MKRLYVHYRTGKWETVKQSFEMNVETHFIVRYEFRAADLWSDQLGHVTARPDRTGVFECLKCVPPAWVLRSISNDEEVDNPGGEVQSHMCFTVDDGDAVSVPVAGPGHAPAEQEERRPEHTHTNRGQSWHQLHVYRWVMSHGRWHVINLTAVCGGGEPTLLLLAAEQS